MSAEASVIKKPSREERLNRNGDRDIFSRPATPFTPTGDSIFSHVEPSAIGSVAVLVALIGAIGFGGWTVLKEVQRVQVSPVDQTPIVLSDLDPLQGALVQAQEAGTADVDAPRAEALDRLYRPQALDVPVLVARDAPIATLDPRTSGVFTAAASAPAIANPDDGDPRIGATVQFALDDVNPDIVTLSGPVPQVVEEPVTTLRMVAAYDSWVSVKAADGTTLFEAIMNKGDVFEVPAMEEPPTLLTGESGALYFAMQGGCYGPVGPSGSITKNLPLHREALAELYKPVAPGGDGSLNRMFVDLSTTLTPSALAAIPCQTQ